MNLMIQSWCPGTKCDPCAKHGKTATTPRISLSTGGVQGYDLGPTLWNYYTNLGWGIVIIYDPNTGIYTEPPWNPNDLGAPSMPVIPPVPIYDSRNQVVSLVSSGQNLSIVQPLNNSLTYFGGFPDPPPSGPPPYINVQGPGDWVGSVGESLGGLIDEAQITIPDNWWGWISGNISDQTLHVTAKKVYINRSSDIGVGFGGSWSYAPQWNYGGTWYDVGTWYFWPDYLNIPGHT